MTNVGDYEHNVVGPWVDGMANECEPPHLPLSMNKPNVLTGLAQKGCDPGAGVVIVLPQAERSPVNWRGLTHRGTCVERGKSVLLPRGTASCKVSQWGCGYGIAEKANASL